MPKYNWNQTHGTFIAGRSHIDGMDETAIEAEIKWGADRLRLLVTHELREKFDRQRYLVNQAIWFGQLEDVKRETGRMVKAYEALDRAAEANGARKLPPEVWEVPLDNGFVAAVVKDSRALPEVEAIRSNRRMVVYTMEEIARILSAYPALSETKLKFPGAEITAVKRSVSDPLDEIHDTSVKLDDPIPDFGAPPQLG